MPETPYGWAPVDMQSIMSSVNDAPQRMAARIQARQALSAIMSKVNQGDAQGAIALASQVTPEVEQAFTPEEMQQLGQALREALLKESVGTGAPGTPAIGVGAAAGLAAGTPVTAPPATPAGPDMGAAPMPPGLLYP